jgi:hypothetical protein
MQKEQKEVVRNGEDREQQKQMRGSTREQTQTGNRKEAIGERQPAYVKRPFSRSQLWYVTPCPLG